MGIISIDEEFGKRSASIDQLYERSYVRSFVVVTSDPYVGPIAVRAATGIPGIGTRYQNGVAVIDPRHEFDNGSFVQGIEVEEISDQIEWRVTVTYGPWNPAIFDPDRLLWPIRVQFGGEKTDRVVYFDNAGNPIRNSARDRFEDAVTVDDHLTTLLITRNELVSAFDIGFASLYSDTINDATWNTIPVHQAKMGIITTSEEKYDSNTFRWYYTVTYPVEVSRKPWRKDLLDQGYNAVPAGGSVGSVPARPMHGPDGQPYNDPQLLDGAGHKLPLSGVPVTLPFDVYDEADWSALGIDLSVRLGL